MIDPNQERYWNIDLWCVMGEDCFPQLFCCRVLNHATEGPTIWGYSVYRRVPGFRTLGLSLPKFIESRRTKFFDTQQEALKHLEKITTPRPRH